MNKKLKIVLALLGTFGFLFIDYSLSLGWLVGWIALFVLAYFRELYYSSILSEEQFSVGRYVRYILFVFLILWVAPIFGFIFPEILSPYALLATYFVDRFILYLGRIFKKESMYVTK